MYSVCNLFSFHQIEVYKMNNISTTEQFFSLLKYSIGSSDEFPYTPTFDEWNEIFDISVKHTLIGITYLGIERLPNEKKPQKELYIKWHLSCERIKTLNKKCNSVASSVSQKFREEGFRNVIIKGQGIALYYPQPLYRQPGDIDIWLEGSRDKIVKYLRSVIHTNTLVCYHHIAFPINPNIDIEVHFTPSWQNNPVTNLRLQKFFKLCSDKEFGNMVELDNYGNKATVSTLDFNRIFILLHCFRHIFAEGVGLRQLLDYYMVLQQGFTEKERNETIRTIKELNLFGFTRAVIYVLQQVFGLKEEFMIVKPDVQQGEFLLHEIMLSGNFGKYDTRNGNIFSNNAFKRIPSKLYHAMRFIKYHPMETICTPLFRSWHFLWRKIKNRYYKSTKFITS